MKPHIAVNVRSVERSLAFYRTMLGVEPATVRRGYARFDVESPPLALTLDERAPAERGALYHLGIQVAAVEDVIAIRDRWLRAGLAPSARLETNCGFAIQEKSWVRDPDGNAWEVFVVLEDDLPEAPVWLVEKPDPNEAPSGEPTRVCGNPEAEAHSCCDRRSEKEAT